MSEFKAVVFQCGNEEYAISVDSIVSIERLEQVNPNKKSALEHEEARLCVHILN